MDDLGVPLFSETSIFINALKLPSLVLFASHACPNFERAMLTKMAVTALISHVTVALVETDAWPTAQLWMPSAAQAGWCIPKWFVHFLLVRCWNIHWHLTHRVLFFRLRSYLKPQVTHHVLFFRLRSYLKPQVLRFLLKFSYIHGSWLLNIIGAEGRTAPRAR